MRKTISTILCSKAAILLFVWEFLLFCCFSQKAVGAAEGISEQHRSLLVIYTTRDGKISEAVRLLDLALGHFADHIAFTSDESVAEHDLSGVTHLIYYGEIPKQLSQHSKQVIASFPGPLLVIGHNIEQLAERFPQDRTPRARWINRIFQAAASDEWLLDHDQRIMEVWLPKGEPILYGAWGEQVVPLLVMQGEDAYFASADLQEPMLYVFGEGLHTFFQAQHPQRHLAYLRLEDVDPLSEPVRVKAAGEYLASRGIPFMIALRPVVIDPVTAEQYHLKNAPDLIEVLKELQERGASMILQGDRDEWRRFAHGDTEAQLKQEIRALTELGLEPVGFELPHDTMSPEGYHTVADYFRYLVGQVQLGDRNGRTISSAPYVTRPHFLQGMTLLAETVGDYNPDSLTSLVDVEKKIRDMRFVRDGIIGMYYHPQLDIDHLQEMVALAEAVPHVQWIDLKHWHQAVKENVAEVDCARHACTGEDSPHTAGQSVLAQLLWLVSGVVAFTVIAFFVYTLKIRMGLRKALFEERYRDG